jgi:hypothetical protein
MNTGLRIQIASTFACGPIEASLDRAVVEAGIADGLSFAYFTQMSEYLLAPKTSGILGTVVVLRLEDWLREDLKSAPHESAQSETGPSESGKDAWIRQQFRLRVDEFVSQLAILSHSGKQVWFLACPSNGWICNQHKLAGLCRTYTNLVTARVRNLPQVTVLNWPASLSAGGSADLDADREENLPFTRDAFQQMGESLGQQLARTVLRNEGESAASSGAPELAAYLEGLQVRVQLTPAGREDRLYVDKLLRTVASFSLTGERPAISQAEVDAFMAFENCLLVSVADRISDYGPSGLVAFRTVENGLLVESMALSCTVLGKQVECAILSALARLAFERGVDRILFQYHSSGRNQPMLAFLDQIAERESDMLYLLRASAAEAKIREVAINPGAWSVTEMATRQA